MSGVEDFRDGKSSLASNCGLLLSDQALRGEERKREREGNHNAQSQ